VASFNEFQNFGLSSTQPPSKVIQTGQSLRIKNKDNRPTMSLEQLTTISPITNKPVLTRNGLSDVDIKQLLSNAVQGFQTWKNVDPTKRLAIVTKALDLLSKKEKELAKELTEQMGRPINYTPSEVKTAIKRGEYLCSISQDVLKDTPGQPEKGFTRYIKKLPLGPILIIFAWNASLISHFLFPHTHTHPAPYPTPPLACSRLHLISLTQ
jgi:acyl-CoA reductase-like NAD-dependent aldehyde dehydrogenase